jgi:hypothetical protein
MQKLFTKGDVFQVPGYKEWIPMPFEVKKLNDTVFTIFVHYEWTSNFDIRFTSIVPTVYGDAVKIIGSKNDWYWIRNKQKVHGLINQICNDCVDNHVGFDKYEKFLTDNDKEF